MDEKTLEQEMAAIQETFKDEAAEILDNMEEALLAIEKQPSEDGPVHELFRGAHTIKGSARIAGFDHVSDFTHSFEELIDGLLRKRLEVKPDLISLSLEAVDTLRSMIASANHVKSQLSAEELALKQELVDRGGSGGDEPDHRQEAQRDNGRSPAQEAAAGQASHRTRTIRVGTEKLDRLMDLVGEIAISRGRMRDLLESGQGLLARELFEEHRESDLLYLELQEQVMKMRMVPVGRLFKDFHRTVRDLARRLGKEARLTIRGEDAEVDTTVVEQLRDPLIHLVSNAMTHGIEAPGERIAAGKLPVGEITLGAYHDSGSVVIEVSDNGRGVPRKKALAKAKSAGIVAEGDDPNEEELLQILFSPGFSTADHVDGVSGRGVGLDVVRRNVELLRGVVGLQSSEGLGTMVTIRLPLTLAIIEGFRVSAGGETYVIPLDYVCECIELPSWDGVANRALGVTKLRSKPLPFIDLREQFLLGAGGTARQNVVVVRHGSLEAGLAVDELHGAAQTVIKPLGRLFKGIQGLAGTAILGNGRVAFVLDVPKLLEKTVRGTRELSIQT